MDVKPEPGEDVTEFVQLKQKGVEQDLREAYGLLHAVTESIPDAIFVKDAQGRYLMVNGAGARFFGRPAEEVLGKDDDELLPPEAARELIEDDRQIMAEGASRSREEVTMLGGVTRTYLSTKAPYRGPSGEIRGVLGIRRDITERKRAEQALWESRERLAGIVNSAMDAIVSVDSDRRIFLFNAAAEKMFGYTAQEVFGLPLWHLIPERSRAAYDQHVRDFPASGVEVRRIGALHETRGLRADGEEFPIETSISHLDVGGQKVLTVIHRDISERRLAEDALRESAAELRAVSVKLAEAQEAERRAIARELHDQIGQSLTALSLNLTILREQVSGKAAEAMAGRVDDSLELVDATAERVRSLMVELQPPLLDDYGLAAAFRWYARQVSERSGIAVRAYGQDPEPRLGRDKEIALFRIAQEALTNVTKHAAAAHVEIALEATDRGARLTIADDGRGFDPAGVRSPQRTPAWGLRTMAERAAAAGGRLRIESAPGKGARVVVEIEEDS